MVQIEYIRWLYYQQHQSIRAIARKLGHSRKTVRKVLALEDPREHKYPRGLPKPRPVMGPVEHIIEAWLKEEEASLSPPTWSFPSGRRCSGMKE